MKITKMLTKKFGDRFKTDVNFKDVTTFKIGGKIKYFVQITSKKEAIFLVKFCVKYKIKFFVLGGGSNILASDDGFDGLVISTTKFCGVKIKNGVVVAESGIYLSNLVMKCKISGLCGMEWAVGIPGTVGGAAVMNAGAFDGEIANNIISVEFFDGEKVCVLKKEDLEFSYRRSIFKKMKNFIILSVKLSFYSETIDNISQNIFFYIEKRKSMQNIGYPSAGSVFKRSQSVIPAKLIDEANLKGKRVGDAMVSTVHSGFIVNLNKATCKDVLKLIDFISNSVYNIFTKKLELEIIVIGENKNNEQS